MTMGKNSIDNHKWFIIGAALSGNIKFWTGEGNTNKKIKVNFSEDNRTAILTAEEVNNSE